MMNTETGKKVNKIDSEFKRIALNILENGRYDKNPRPHWTDGTPAHALSINHAMMSFDLDKGEFPVMTLRPVAVRGAIGEILWIYQDASNDINLLKRKYGIEWWNQWALPDGTIGACYGETVRRHNLMHDMLDGMEKDPDGRRHIINLWQVEDFKEPHGLKPCCYQTVYNVRHEDDGDYLDMCLFQRSCDFAIAASTSNQVQYAALQCMVAHHFGYKPGKFTWFGANIQIYDRHIPNVERMLKRESIPMEVYLKINPEKKDFYDITLSDITLEGYDRSIVIDKNPSLGFEIAI